MFGERYGEARPIRRAAWGGEVHSASGMGRRGAMRLWQRIAEVAEGRRGRPRCPGIGVIAEEGRRGHPLCPGIGVIAEEGRRRHPLCPGIGALARMRRYETVDGDKPPRSASLPRSLRMKKTEVESLPSKKTWHHLLAWLSAPASEPATEQIPAAPRTQSPVFVDKTGGRFAPGTQSPAFVDKTGSVLPRDATACVRGRSRALNRPGTATAAFVDGAGPCVTRCFGLLWE